MIVTADTSTAQWFFFVQSSGPRTMCVMDREVAREYVKHKDVRYAAQVGMHMGNPVINALKEPLNYGEAALLETECEQEVRRCIPEDAEGTASLIEHVMREQERLVSELWSDLQWDQDLWDRLRNRLDLHELPPVIAPEGGE